MPSTSGARSEIERIQSGLAQSPLDPAFLEECVGALSALGHSVTTAVEDEFAILVRPSEPTAA